MRRVIDLFAGAGGFGLGFRLAGYDLRLSLEIDKWAADTLRENNPGTIVLEEDITAYRSKDEIRRACGVVPDVIIGGPPCQGFSIARPADKRDPKDPRNSLFKDFARWIGYLQPHAFVLENVRGILSRQNASSESVISIIQRTFAQLGYATETWVLNAAEYGVPQERERVFIVGNRLGKVLGEPPTTHRLAWSNYDRDQVSQIGLRELPRVVSVWEAISDLPKIEAGQGEEEQPYTRDPKTEYQVWARGDQSTVYNHVAMRHTSRVVERFRHIHWCRSVVDAPDEHRARSRNGNGDISQTTYESNNRRLHPFIPSYTIPAHFYSKFIHPYQHRNLTAREAARLQSFPDWYRFMGKRTIVSRKLLERTGRHSENHLSQYNQTGNAVPPLLAKAIAERIQQALNEND